MSSERNAGAARFDEQREFIAFIVTPFVAVALWFCCLFVTYGMIDGWPAAVQDIPSLIVGGALVGLPVAGTATLLLAAPAYAVHVVRGSLTRRVAIGNGALIGAVTMYVVGGFTHDLRWVGTAFGVVIGIASAAVWWKVARVSASSRGHRPDVGS